MSTERHQIWCESHDYHGSRPCNCGADITQKPIMNVDTEVLENCCEQWKNITAVLDEVQAGKMDAPKFCPWCATPTVVTEIGDQTIIRPGKRLESDLLMSGPGYTPNAKLPPIGTGPRRKMLVSVDVAEDFEKRLDNQWMVEREVLSDRWSWNWATPLKLKEPEDTAENYITVTPQKSEQAGSCNACSRYVTGEGITHHLVTQIDLRSCSFRVCDLCLHDLVFKLQLRLTDVLRKA